MASNTKVSVWSPLKGTLPNPGTDITFAQYYVTADGSNTSLGLSFKEGDWLIYLVDDDNVSHWYKTEGGMVTISNLGTSTNAPDSGWYSKVFINDQGNITEGEALDKDDLPEHKHDISEIENVPDKVWEILANIFQNQKLGNVKFDVNTKLKKITASVVVDEETIGTNEYGELYAIVSGNSSGSVDLSGTSIQISQVENLTTELNQIKADIANSSSSGYVDVSDIPIDEQTITINKNGKLQANTQKNQAHTHSIADLTDLPECATTPASEQYLTSEHVNFNEGALELDGTLDVAIYKINSYLSELNSNITTLQNQSGKIKPAAPKGTSYATVTIKNESLTVLNKYSLKECSAYLGPKPLITISGIYPNNQGALSFLIDGEEVDSLALETISINGTYNNSYVEFLDAYAGNANLEGFFNTAFINWTCPIKLKNGTHTFQLKHVSTDTVYTEKLSFLMVGDHGSLTYTTKKESIPTNDSYVSGIPCTKKENITISGSIVIPWEDDYIPVDFITTNDENYNLVPNISELTISVSKTYNDVSGSKGTYITLKDYSGSTILNKTFTTDKLRYDGTTCEQYRIVRNTEGEYTSYNQSDTLANTELPIDQGIVGINKSYTYYKGPDYSAQVTRTEYEKSVYEIAFAIDCPDFINSFYVDLESDTGAAFNTIKGKLQNIIVCACLTNATQPEYWATTLNPFDGISACTNDSFGALDLARSTSTRKYITFGRQPVINAGTLYVKFLLEKGYTLNVEKAINSIIQSIEESLC